MCIEKIKEARGCKMLDYGVLQIPTNYCACPPALLAFEIIDDPGSTPPPNPAADNPCAGPRKDAYNYAEGFPPNCSRKDYGRIQFLQHVSDRSLICDYLIWDYLRLLLLSHNNKNAGGVDRRRIAEG